MQKDIGIGFQKPTKSKLWEELLCVMRCRVGDLRGLALFEKHTGQVELKRGFHHFDRQRFELQCYIILGRRSTGILLHIDFS